MGIGGVSSSTIKARSTTFVISGVLARGVGCNRRVGV